MISCYLVKSGGLDKSRRKLDLPGNHRTKPFSSFRLARSSQSLIQEALNLNEDSPVLVQKTARLYTGKDYSSPRFSKICEMPE